MELKTNRNGNVVFVGQAETVDRSENRNGGGAVEMASVRAATG